MNEELQIAAFIASTGMCLAPLGWLSGWFEVFDKRHCTKSSHVALGELIAATDMTGGQFEFAVGFAHFVVLELTFESEADWFERRFEITFFSFFKNASGVQRVLSISQFSWQYMVPPMSASGNKRWTRKTSS